MLNKALQYACIYKQISFCRAIYEMKSCLPGMPSKRCHSSVISSTPYKEVATPLKTLNEADVDWSREGDCDTYKVVCSPTLTVVIGLMHDGILCSKFTTKPRLRKLFLTLCHLCAVFTWVFFSSCCFENSFMIKFTSLHFESEAWW